MSLPVHGDVKQTGLKFDSSTYYLLHKDSSYFEAADEEESTEATDQE